jgi:hypothetical protein
LTVSNQTGPNPAVIDVPDPDPIPDVILGDDIEEEYEEFGADGSVSFRKSMQYERTFEFPQNITGDEQ